MNTDGTPLGVPLPYAVKNPFNWLKLLFKTFRCHHSPQAGKTALIRLLGIPFHFPLRLLRQLDQNLRHIRMALGNLQKHFVL